ncbi:hypothetical protein V6N11_008546 [Hibiscus sabdariffa]|uniref:Uncharacterized protein n=1 Tax=Hibiscus sabdariffa TaxID=183260 RepID=A0ABR2PNL3_9ROSI
MPNISSYHGQPSSLAETHAKKNANAKENNKGAISNLCIDKDDEREERSQRLSDFLGDAHDGHSGLDNIEKEWNYGKLKDKIADDLGNQIFDGFQNMNVSTANKKEVADKV